MSDWENNVVGDSTEFHRYSEQCRNCCCFYANLSDDIDDWIKESMETEQCTQGQMCESKESCWCYLPVEKE